MKKRKWGKKNTFKKTALAIEVLVLVVMVFLTFMFYQTQKKRLESDADRTLEKLYINMDSTIVNHQGSIEEALILAAASNTVASTAEIRDPGTYVWQSDYGIALELYDEKGNVIGQTNQVNHGFIWDPLTGQTEDQEWYDLDSCFSESDIAELMEFYQTTQSRYQCRIVIRQMKGYYQDDQFIPVEIEFYDMDQEDRTFTLKNSEASPGDLVVRTETFLDYGRNENSDEAGQFYLYMDDTRAEVRSQVWKLLQDEKGGEAQWESYSETFSDMEDGYRIMMFSSECNTGNEKIPGYALAAYIDVRHLLWHSFDVWKDLIKTLIFCQGLTAVFIGLYCLMRKKRQQLEEIRDTFINAIAHEMKTPVTVIKNCMEYLEMGAQQEKKEYYRQAAIQEADYLNELLDGMLTYTRVSDASCEIQWEKCDVKALIERIQEHYQTELDQKNIRWEFVCENDCRIYADQKMMKIVLDNLISNAVKYCSNDGRIKISVNGARISVFNEGRNIPEEKLDHIWEPLYRVDEARLAEKGSSGMGLAICENILKMHGFFYGVKNVPGGVSFWFDAKKAS